ncbi:MAG: zinc ribbon domain-containing protein [Oscillospiraceae bacterium]|nr:zinc ribbon domain-containing protein [Oscillospiraceae bacterium]
MFCVNCGKQIADGSAFCDQCGAPQAAPAPAAQPVPQSAAPASPVAKLTKKFPIPNLVALIAALVLLLSIFLPYMAANKEYAEMLDEYGSEVAFPGSDITAKDLKEVSLVEFAGVAEAMADLAPSGSGLEVIPVLVYAIAILGFVAALFAYLKKPVLVIIPSVLAYGISVIFDTGIKESGALNMSVYDWGIAHTLIPLAVLGCIVGAIWMIVDKKKAKKVQNTVV